MYRLGWGVVSTLNDQNLPAGIFFFNDKTIKHHRTWTLQVLLGH